MGGHISCCDKRDKDEEGGRRLTLSEPDAELQIAIRGSPQHVNDVDLERFAHTFVSHCSQRSFEEAYRLHHHETMEKQELGVGGSGSVHKAWDRSTNEVYAVKTISRKGMDSSQSVALKTEVGIMSILDHPHIVKLVEYFEEGDITYLVMEVCLGGELFDRVCATQGFSEHIAAGYVRQILLAVAYLHKHNIAHRDIKPENFLLQDREDETHVKLIDFGIAAKIKPGGKLRAQMGTPEYLAPEILSSSYDTKVDIWSCGVVFYIMLTFSPLFDYTKKDGPSVKKTMTNLKEDFLSAPSLKKLLSRLSPGAQSLIRKMLSVDPNKRPTAADLLKDPWLNKEAPRLSLQLDSGIIQRFRAFNKSRKLKQICMTIVATQLNEGEVSKLRDVFESLDSNGDGSLSRQELLDGMEAANLDRSAIEQFMKLDSDGSGEIDWTEFLAAAVDLQQVRRKEVLASCFRKFDVDGDGQITKDELAKALAGADVEISEEAIQDLMNEADLNGDGTISLAEFETMMTSAPVSRRNSLMSMSSSKS